jgi:hypothetical protein
LLHVLDTDHNGTLSEREIDQAARSIRHLDRNHDGQVTPEEFMPHPPGMPGPSAHGIFVPSQDQRSPQDRGQPPREPNHPQPNSGPGFGGPFNGPPWSAEPEIFAERMMERFDEDHDGKLDRRELMEMAEEMQRRMGPRADALRKAD